MRILHIIDNLNQGGEQRQLWSWFEDRTLRRLRPGSSHTIGIPSFSPISVQPAFDWFILRKAWG